MPYAVKFRCANCVPGQTPLHCAIEAHRKTLDDSKEKIDSRHVLMVLCEHGADLNKPVYWRIL